MDNTEEMDSMSAFVDESWSSRLPLLIGIAALLGLGKGGVPGFATVATAATVATSPTNIPGGLGLAVALQVPILTMIDISAAWLHYEDLDFESIKLLLPMSFLGMALGTWLDKHLTDASARFLVGLLLLMILAVQLGKDAIMGTNNSSSNKDNKEVSVESDLEGGQTTGFSAAKSPLRRRNHPSDSSAEIIDSKGHGTSERGEKNRSKTTLDRKTKYIWACTVGIVGGAATMLTNAMGPILNVYLLSVAQLSPAAYIGTRAMFFCFLNMGKLPMRFISGTLGWPMMPLAGFLGMVSVAGVLGAKPIMLSMSQENFVRLELAVIAFSGVRLCWMGING